MTALRDSLKAAIALDDAIRALEPGDWVMTKGCMIYPVENVCDQFVVYAGEWVCDVSDIIEVRKARAP